MNLLKRLFSLFFCIQLFIGSSHASLPFGARDVVIAQTTTTATAFACKTLTEVRGGGFLPGGWNPFGYKVTELGERFIAFDGSLDGDVGRFLASLKTRKTKAALKAQWVEIVKVSKTGQTMRIYRTTDELLKFCLDAG
eukprot:CAMPEP_0119013612 /NCGR_PEP_ID=MMETSP1176-20130426/8585_1 /TAXON_ID=265551 /ORGANISM="Synedropsis recta cf, Strain CCMP1620" /LENGTH=137 /DNA_ID=CAMNT_0006966715 /DNA_START=128 /DNA_END=537 /DNA_ORIENTATION=+